MDIEEASLEELAELELAIAAAEAEDDSAEAPASTANLNEDEDEESEEDAAMLAALEAAEAEATSTAMNVAGDEEDLTEEDAAVLDALEADTQVEEQEPDLQKQMSPKVDSAAQSTTDDATEPARELSWKELKAQAEAAEAAAEAAEAAAEAAEAAAAVEAAQASQAAEVAAEAGSAEQVEPAEAAEDVSSDVATASNSAEAALSEEAKPPSRSVSEDTECHMQCSETLPSLSPSEEASAAKAADAAEQYGSEPGSGWGDEDAAPALEGVAIAKTADPAADPAEGDSLPDLEEEPEDTADSDTEARAASTEEGAESPSATEGAQSPNAMKGAEEPSAMEGAEEPSAMEGAEEPSAMEGVEESGVEESAQWAQEAARAAEAWAVAEEPAAAEGSPVEEEAWAAAACATAAWARKEESDAVATEDTGGVLRTCTESEMNVQMPEEPCEEFVAECDGGFARVESEEPVSAPEEAEASALDLQGRDAEQVEGSVITVWYLEGAAKVGYVGTVLSHERSGLEVQFDNSETIGVTAEDEWRWGDHTSASIGLELSEEAAADVDVEELPTSAFVHVYRLSANEKKEKKHARLKMDPSTRLKLPLRDAQGKVHEELLGRAQEVMRTGMLEGVAVFAPEQTRLQVRSLSARVAAGRSAARAESAPEGTGSRDAAGAPSGSGPAKAGAHAASPGAAFGAEYAGWTRKESKSHRGHWYLRSPGGSRKVWEASIKQKAAQQQQSQQKTSVQETSTTGAEVKEYPAPRKLDLEEGVPAVEPAAELEAEPEPAAEPARVAEAPHESAAEPSASKRKAQSDAKTAAGGAKRARAAAPAEDVDTASLAPKLKKKLKALVPSYKGKTGKITFGDVLDRLQKDLGTDMRHAAVKPLVKELLVQQLVASRANM